MNKIILFVRTYSTQAEEEDVLYNMPIFAQILR